MIINKTDFGFRCTLSEEYLASKGIDIHNIYEISPVNPAYMKIMQDAMHYATQKAYITPSMLSMIEVEQNIDPIQHCVILDFTKKGDICDKDIKHLTSQDKAELMQQMAENDEINPSKNHDAPVEEQLKKTTKALKDIYYKNHPDENIKKHQETNSTMTVIAVTRKLDNMIELCSMLPVIKDIGSVLYKYKDQYYLVMDMPAKFVQTNDTVILRINTIVAECNATYDNNNPYIKAMLDEHGTTVIKKDAISILASI